MLAPGCFIPVAESINLAGELDRWVLRRACNEFSEWQSAGLGHDALLRINVSAGQLVTGGFVDFVADTIGQHGLDASSVCLEITENVVVQDLHTARATLARLKEVGVHIAIDDFGTGYSAISLLQTLPIDTLKIDKTFVRQLGTNTSDLVIVRGIMTLAEGFQLDVVAEGVETEAAARILLDQRCYRAQGFLFSRPVPGEAMRHMLSARRLPPTCIPATDPALS
ncbi:diguanylate cyclase [Mycobacterium tuberculosis]|nr:diguanylate cyclase [Mycobacterium tuberculosis]